MNLPFMFLLTLLRAAGLVGFSLCFFFWALRDFEPSLLAAAGASLVVYAMATFLFVRIHRGSIR